MTLRRTCPACGRAGTPFRTGRVIARDLVATKRCFRELAAEDDVPPLKLMHDEGVEVWRCGACGTLWRADAALWSSAVGDYEDDEYPDDMLPSTHRADRDDVLDNAPFFARAGVCPGARVVEIACYTGGFLAAARHLGASALGVDPNPQLVEFCRALGLDAVVGTIDTVPDQGDTDVLAVLNCFDQVPDPNAFLRAAAGLVRPGGSIVLRTPNADFATTAHRREAPARVQETARRHLVWGLPYLACYSPRALDAMLRRAGFAILDAAPKPADDIDADAPLHRAPWLQVIARRRA